LIDWGLAEFYFPRTEYNVRVASRYFKGPELLVNMRDYDYSLDIWSVGCMFAGMLFMVHPFFHGKDNNDQLVVIAKVLGTQALDAYLEKYGLKLEAALEEALETYQRRPWTDFITAENAHLSNRLALELLDQMLQFDHQARPTCQEAMAHPYFEQVRAEEAAAITAGRRGSSSSSSSSSGGGGSGSGSSSSSGAGASSANSGPAVVAPPSISITEKQTVATKTRGR